MLLHKKRCYFLFIFVVHAFLSTAQVIETDSLIEIGQFFAKKPGGKAILKGKVTNPTTGELLIGASVLLEETNIGSTTNEKGEYALIVPLGEHTIVVQYIGMETLRKKIIIHNDGVLTIGLNEEAYGLKEVVVTSKLDDQNIRDVKTLNELSLKEIKELPTFMGEVDVIKSLLLLPGVSTVGEGSAGFNVRGGQIDQNLVLQNGAQLFNSSHVLGFFSAFNPDVVDKFTLYKSNIPAQFGGRISSVLDVTIKDGDFEQHQIKGGLGIVSSRLVAEGPLARGKTSFLVGGRISYSDWVLNLVTQPEIQESSVSFWDANASLAHKINDKHKIALSFYGSNDFFRFSDEFGYSWGTQTGSLKWNGIYSTNFSSTTTLVYGDYKSNYFVPSGDFDFSLDNGMRYYQFKHNFLNLIGEQHQINYGIEANIYQNKADELSPYTDDSFTPLQSINKDNGREFALYVNDEFDLGEKVSLNLGLRYSYYQNIGPDDVFSYAENETRTEFSIIDTTFYQEGEVIQSYGGIEPRVGVRFSLGPASSIKASYNRMRQYLHLISNTTAPTPVDIYQVSNPFLAPQIADNYTLGLFKNFNQNVWESSIEFYYKNIQNLVDYKNFAQLLLNDHLETDVLSGKGRAYGMEVYLRRKAGRWTGWLSYAFARSLIQLDGTFPEERINNGEWFPTNFDQPHTLTLVGRRQIKKRSSFSFNFTYRTGRPITAATSNYEINNSSISHFSNRNQYRIPNYVRLDVALTIAGKQRKRFDSDFTLSIYNVLFRQNAFSVFYQRIGNSFITKPYQLSVLGTAFPALTYNFRF